MKKFILMLVFIFGTFAFSEMTTSEVESFFSPKVQIYVSNQKDLFCTEVPGTDEIDCREFNYFVNVVPVGNKYRVSYTPLDDVKSYDKEKYPILRYRTEKKYYVKSRKKQDTPVTDSYGITIDYVISPGAEKKR